MGPVKKTRIFSYDVFRGVLLVGMVVFHVVVNLTPLQFNQELFYWVPLGFVLFLGVVLGRFLRGRTAKKFGLAVKLLAVFLVGNVLNFRSKEIGFYDFLIGDPQIFSFEILAPMTAVILMSIALDKIGKGWALGLLLFLALPVLQYFEIHSYNLAFGIYGLIGYFIGRSFDLDGWTEKKIWMVPACVLAVGVFGVIRFFGLFDFLVVLQVLGLYFLSAFALGNNRILSILGRHSLLLYVAHIVLIKALSA